MERVLRIGLSLTAFGVFGMVLVGAPQGDASGNWLDARTANWNRPGAAIPLAPKTTGIPAAACASMLATPQSREELALSRAGWLLPGRTPPSNSSVSVILAMSSFGAMCRPNEYQQFVFVDGQFAGTLSPTLMYARLDGSSIKLSFNAKQELVVEFARYGPHDPLCCPSFVSTAEYEILSENGRPVVSLKNATTRAAR